MSGYCSVDFAEDADWYLPEGETEEQITAIAEKRCCECGGMIQIGESCWYNRGSAPEWVIDDAMCDWISTLDWETAATLLGKDVAAIRSVCESEDFDWQSEWENELDEYFEKNLLRQIEDESGVEDFYQHELCRRIARWMNLGIIGTCDVPYGYVAECLGEWEDVINDEHDDSLVAEELRKHSKRIVVTKNLLKRQRQRTQNPMEGLPSK